MTSILCENIKCEFCRQHIFYGKMCFADRVTSIDKNGKCITYKKDTLENIKLMKANKFKL